MLAQALFILTVLLVVHVPLGDYLAKALDGGRHLKAERLLYRLCGVDPDAEQSWGQYLLALLAFTALSVVVLFGLLTFQDVLPWNVGHQGMPWDLALHTAVSFTTNTSWQNYAGESPIGHTQLTLMAGLGVQAFASAAVGTCAGLALIRGLVRRGGAGLGNFWVDLLRSIVRVLLPLSFVFALVLIGLGVQQNLSGPHTVSTLAGGTQTLLGGPIGSWAPIKLMSGDGGGAFNVSSAHPFENPTAMTNAVGILLMLLVPTAFIRLFGRMSGNLKLGWTLLAVVAVLFALLLTAGHLAQSAQTGTVAQAVGGQYEGTETRIGIPGSTLFGVTATATADGAVNSSYDSFSSFGGGVLLAAMMLGEIAPGGTGSGLYGLLIAVLVAVFLGGLMVGRTPDFLGKRVGRHEMRYVALYTLTAPALILTFTALAIALPGARASMGNTGPHGLTEVLYAYTSSVNSNGSAMAGLSGNTPFYNLTMTVAMLAGRYVPIVFVLALAGRMASGQPVAVTAGSLRTHGLNFATLATGAALILALLNFLPALSLGPIADGLPR
ncbi:potassium-transporting ATPase subunit KdpA [Nonomuraea jiangxiensis]|uniref:Potassium-transporting ATPase potassium-binding subunit n=1 Tax=Nonomuraea jiangxiensis TaxID=633440 RepID=A0A1G8DHC5_9ACTN|nr:potassium-transporting ATPase subunit KdpA [Nonomuraea jiangxiensis]SDH57052.1 K+-transporting ATPase ATPase A chain [Nonomuraea jiangxiensis]